MSVDFARVKCTYGLPPNEDNRVIKLSRDATQEQLYKLIEEEFGQSLIVYKYLDSEGSPITVREGGRLDLEELLEDIPTKQYLRLYVREPQILSTPKSPVFTTVKRSFAPPTASSLEDQKVLLGSGSFDDSSGDQDSRPHTPEPEIVLLDKAHIHNGSTAPIVPTGNFKKRAPPKIETNFGTEMILNPEDRADRTPQPSQTPAAPFAADDISGSYDMTAPEKTPPPSPVKYTGIVDFKPLSADDLFSIEKDREKNEETKSSSRPRRVKGERKGSRSGSKQRSGSDQKQRRSDRERKPKTPIGTESPFKVTYEQKRRKTVDSDDRSHGIINNVDKENDNQRTKLNSPVDINANGDFKKEVNSFILKNSKEGNNNPNNNNFNNFFVKNPGLDNNGPNNNNYNYNGPPTPIDLVRSTSSDGSRASQSIEAPASPMTNSAPPTPVSDMPALLDTFRWRKMKLIGTGAFGRVYEGLLESTGEFIAVKEMDLPDHVDPKTEVQYRSFKQEEELLKSLQHPNIVKFLGSQTEKNKIYVFLELVEGGSISSIIAKCGGGLGEPVTRVYARQILMGLDYLHNNKIIHRDIKGANILVNTKGIVKVADFGASKTLQNVLSRDNMAKSMSGTPYFMAPEVFQNQGYSTPADIWSFGCTVLEMITGIIPWSRECDNIGSLVYILTNTNRLPPMPENCSPELKDFIKLCLIKNPKDRPSASELLKHPWLSTTIVSAPVPAASLPSSLRTSVDPSLLPREVALHIFSFLEIKDVVHCLKTCAHWRGVGQDNFLWRRACLARWNKLKLLNNADPKLAEKDSLEGLQMKLSGTTMMTTIELEQLDYDSVEKGRWKKFYVGLLEYDRKWVQYDLKQAMAVKGHNKPTTCVLLHQKGKKLITGSEDKKIKVWDLTNIRTGKRSSKPVSQTYKGHTSSVQCLALMPGERMLFSGATDKSIRVWDLESRSRKTTKIFEGHEHTVTSLHAPFVTNAELSGHVISGSLDSTVKLWDIERGINVTTLKGHKRGVTAVKESEGIIISAGLDHVLRLWDARANQCVGVLEGHQDEITCFDSIGHVILSASKDGVIREWNLRGASISEWPGLYIDNKPVNKDRIVSLKFDALSNVMTLSNTADDCAVLRVWNYNSERCHTEVSIRQEGIDLDLNLHHLDLNMLHSTLLVHDLGTKSSEYVMASCGGDIRLWSLVPPNTE